MKPAEAFHHFNKYIESHQRKDQTKYNSVVNFLKNNTDITIHEILPGGSYDRRTRVPNESDIDIVVLTSASKPSEDARDYFQDIWEKINNAANNVTKGLRAIKFDFKSISVDFVPAYGKSRNKTPWYIANSKQNIWEPTDPKKNKKVLNSINKKHKSKVIPMIRFFKYWNYKNKKCRFKSFYLEAIVMDIFQNDKSFKDLKWPKLFNEITKKLKLYVDKTIPEPAGVGPNLFVRHEDKKCLKKRISTLTNHSNSAVKLEKQKQYQQSILEWKKVFGNKFGKKY